MVAPGTAAAVRHVGGWLFDRVMAGWDATVLVVGQSDARPLRILGAEVNDLESALACPVAGPRPQAIAVDAGLYGSDGRVRQIVREALDEGATEVRIWGDTWPDDLDCGGGPLEHRLSVAARAFKAQAMAAAAEVGVLAGTETFRSGERPRLVPVT